MEKLGERMVTLDCDVLVADGGTRTTSISGAYVAMKLAFDKLLSDGLLSESPLTDALAAVSIGINENGKVIADLNYEEDSTCETDMNIVMTRKGHFVEVQGTAEGAPFSRDQLNAILDCAASTLNIVFEEQDKVINA